MRIIAIIEYSNGVNVVEARKVRNQSPQTKTISSFEEYALQGQSRL